MYALGKLAEQATPYRGIEQKGGPKSIASKDSIHEERSETSRYAQFLQLLPPIPASPSSCLPSDTAGWAAFYYVIGDGGLSANNNWNGLRRANIVVKPDLSVNPFYVIAVGGLVIVMERANYLAYKKRYRTIIAVERSLGIAHDEVKCTKATVEVLPGFCCVDNAITGIATANKLYGYFLSMATMLDNYGVDSFMGKIMLPLLLLAINLLPEYARLKKISIESYCGRNFVCGIHAILRTSLISASRAHFVQHMAMVWFDKSQESISERALDVFKHHTHSFVDIIIVVAFLLNSLLSLNTWLMTWASANGLLMPEQAINPGREWYLPWSDNVRRPLTEKPKSLFERSSIRLKLATYDKQVTTLSSLFAFINEVFIAIVAAIYGEKLTSESPWWLLYPAVIIGSLSGLGVCKIIWKSSLDCNYTIFAQASPEVKGLIDEHKKSEELKAMHAQAGPL